MCCTLDKENNVDSDSFLEEQQKIRWILLRLLKSKTFQNIWVPQFAVQGLLDQCLLLKSAKVR